MNIYKIFILISLVISFQSCSENTKEGNRRNKRPLLIMAQRFTPEGYPDVMINHMQHIESMPFDGMFVNTAIGWYIMRGKPVSYEEIMEEVKVLNGAYKKFNHNFFMIFIDFPGDLWNDTAWSITARNFGNMARVARELGFAGIAYDNEEYGKRKWLNYGETYQNPGYSLDQHRDQMILRGKQVMEAMTREFPRVKVLTFHGPYVSEPKTSKDILKGQAGSWKGHELSGPFFVGMVLGKGKKAKVIDGGEVYQYRTPEDFELSYNWRKFGISSDSTDSWVIPPNMRKSWAKDIDIAYGVYNRQWKKEYPMTPEIMRTTLMNALNATDEYIWFWTETDSWEIPGEMPQEWVDVVREVYEMK